MRSRSFLLDRLEPRRLLSAGTLDARFGDGGVVLADLSLVPRALAVRANGQVLVAAQIDDTVDGDRDFYLLRLHVDGSMDESFGTKQVDFGGIDNVNAMLIQPDGRIVLAGRTLVDGEDLPAVARLNADGSPDATFSGDGRQVVNIGGTFIGAVSALAIQSDGRLLLGAANAVVRLTPGGAADTTFGSGGMTTLLADGRSGAVSSLALGADGRVYATQYVRGFRDEIQVARLTTAGALDSTFSGDGRAFLPGPSEAQIIPQPSNKLLVASIGGLGDSVQVRRLNADGGVDSSFGASGSARVPVPGAAPVLRKLIGGPDGRFVAAGFSGGVEINELDAFVARFDSAGAPDSGFGTDGVTRVDAFGGDRLADAAVAPNGKIVFTAFAERQDDGDFTGRAMTARLLGTSVAPSASITRTGTLLVQGSELAETIDITSTANDRVRVSINGIETTFPARNVKRVAVFAGAGNDTIAAESTVGASFELAGENGNDTISGNGKANVIRGGGGDDALSGLGGNDTIFGDAGNDRVDGGSGNDLLDGGPGNDTLLGFAGNDTLFGGDGEDSLDGGSGVDDVIA